MTKMFEVSVMSGGYQVELQAFAGEKQAVAFASDYQDVGFTVRFREYDIPDDAIDFAKDVIVATNIVLEYKDAMTPEQARRVLALEEIFKKTAKEKEQFDSISAEDVLESILKKYGV